MALGTHQARYCVPSVTLVFPAVAAVNHVFPAESVIVLSVVEVGIRINATSRFPLVFAETKATDCADDPVPPPATLCTKAGIYVTKTSTRRPTRIRTGTSISPRMSCVTQFAGCDQDNKGY